MLCSVWPDRRKNLWERKTILELIFFGEENILTLKMFSRKLENLVECKEFDYQDYVKFRQNYNLSCDVLIQFVHSSDYLEIKIKVRSESVQPSPTSQYMRRPNPSLCLGNHNVQVFPVSSKQVRSEERGPLGLVDNPSGLSTLGYCWSNCQQSNGETSIKLGWLEFISIKSTQLEVVLVVQEIQFYRSVHWSNTTNTWESHVEMQGKNLWFVKSWQSLHSLIKSK